MHIRETSDHLFSSLLAVTADALAVFGGLYAAVWMRFHSGWFPIDPEKGIPSDADLLWLMITVDVVFLAVFRSLHLFKRPHQGRFEDKIPRILRAIGISFILYFAMEAALRLDPGFSRKALGLAVFTVTFLVLLERYIIYRIELHQARHAPTENRVLMLGTDASAIRLWHAIESDKFLRARILGFLRIDAQEPWPDAVPEALRMGELDRLEPLIGELKPNHVVLSDIGLNRDRLLHMVVLCEQNYISFHLVPDLFRILTSDLEVRHLEGIPVMGLGQWPLDQVGARILKRCFDIGFSLCALLGTSPVLLLSALAIKFTSKGPVFYRQERCGEKGRTFEMIKLRTMVAEAEAEGPGWTTPDDPRRTPVGSLLRKWNIDELPQFWNVLMGHMSVVGPRPERPHYVEQFKEEIERYMRRHVHKPGITGWAQVHGLRGDTSIQERITYDLFYLENWSIGLDIKIILKTLASRENAY
jgi:exopolysaccharide biosynthesis polyprenyl glycosylphosphotransferase